MRDPHLSPPPSPTFGDHLIGKGFDPTKIRVVVDNTVTPQPKTPEEVKKENINLLIEEMQEIINPGQPKTEAPITPETTPQRKEGWTKVDFKLEAAVNELKELEKTQNPEDKKHIDQLYQYIRILKEQKFSPRGGRGTKAGPELGAAIKEAISEEDKLIESLKNGEGYVVGGEAALSAIDALVKEQDEPLAVVPPEPQPAAPVSQERAAESAKEIFQTEDTVSTPPEQAPQPQDSYARAMNDRWADIEAVQKTAGQSTGEKLELEPLAPKQEALREPLPIPEGMPGPHLVTAAEATKAVETPTATEGEFIPAHEERGTGTPEPEPSTIEGEFARVPEEKEKTPEQLKQEKLEKIRSKLDRMTGVVKEREEKLEQEKPGTIEKIRKVGEWWNGVDKRYKYGVAIAMLLAGGGAWAAGYAVASRLLGGAGLFTTFDTLLQGRYEKKTGTPRSEEVQNRHALYAMVGAIAFTALVGKAADEIRDHFFAAPATVSGGVGTTEAAVTHATPKIEYVVEKGGTLWGGIEHQIDEQGLFAGAGQKTYVIDALKDKFAAMSPDELKAIGITSGNINIIHPGDHIDLTKVMGNQEFLSHVYEQAGNLTPEQVAAIEHPAPAAHGVAEAATSAPAPTPEVPSTIPQEITPAAPSAEIMAAADHGIHEDVNRILGTKGFLGFGAQDGMESIDWKDSKVGFANQPVEKVLAAHPSAFPDDGARHFGIEDYGKTKDMQGYLNEVAKQTNVTTQPNETVNDYLKRAAVTSLTRGTFEGQN